MTRLVLSAGLFSFPSLGGGFFVFPGYISASIAESKRSRLLCAKCLEYLSSTHFQDQFRLLQLVGLQSFALFISVLFTDLHTALLTCDKFRDMQVLAESFLTFLVSL